MFSLYPYQIDNSKKAYEALKKHHIAFCCMEVRTGKTATSMNAAKLYGAKKVLFVTTKKAISSIKKDYKNFGFEDAFHLEVINYESIHKIEDDDFDLFILDESHKLGAFPSPSAKVKVIKEMALDLPIIYLTGTPTPESFSQIFYQLHVSSYSPFKDHKNFYSWVKSGYVHPPYERKIGHRTIPDYSRADKDKISEKIAPFLVTFTQEEAGFKQFPNEIFHNVKMKPFMQQIANYIAKDKYFSLNSLTVTAETAASEKNKIHQLCGGSIIDDEGKGRILDESKILYIKSMFKSQKIAIIYTYKAEFEIIKKHFPNWTNDPDEFNENRDRVFVSQYKSCREGINISTGDCLIMYNTDFSALSYLQIIARMQTKDRVKPIYIHWIFSNIEIGKNNLKLNYDKYIYDTVKNKKRFTTYYYRLINN